MIATKVTRALVAVALVALLAVFAPHATVAAPPDTVIPDGYYFPEQSPRGFPEIQYVDLWTQKPGPAPAYDPIKVPLHGGVRVGGRYVKFARVAIDGLDLTFETVAVRGVKYAFRGTFRRAGHFEAEEIVEGVILDGTLTRLAGTRETARASVAFTFSVGD